jgi:hypothetical protein
LLARFLLLSLRKRKPANPEPAMSLSTQLTRGTLALPMLALFGALALAANQAADASSSLPATPEAVVLHLSESGACGLVTRPALLLAQAPGDLGPIAHPPLRITVAASCRA